MKCPLFYAHEFRTDKEYPPDVNDCLKEECAWWKESVGHCAVLSIPGWLETIRSELNYIAKELSLVRPK